ncbi:MAG: PD-(D/E)XK nuclease family protein [Myxococcales bacterium]|nr:PD-(D/E)XK nuclease family protein [Myxococcales bacterium]
MISDDARAPTVWSYSTLSRVEECPRRWWLERVSAARAPVAGARSSSSSASKGRVCHAALERLLDIHRTLRGPAWGTPEMALFWRQHLSTEGLPGVVRRAIAEEIDGLPRPERLRASAALSEAEPSLVRAVAAMLRVCLSASTGVFEARAEVPMRAQLTSEISWVGRIDAALRVNDDVTLVDFKTGARSESHFDQLLSYACAYPLAPETKGRGEPRRLMVIYSTPPPLEVPAPGGHELVAAREALVARIIAARHALLQAPPPARVEAERCSRCAPRLACDEYWRARDPSANAPQDGVAVELEGVVEAVDRAMRTVMLRVSGTRVLAALADSASLLDCSLGARARVAGDCRRASPEADVEFAVQVPIGGATLVE